MKSFALHKLSKHLRSALLKLTHDEFLDAFSWGQRATLVAAVLPFRSSLAFLLFFLVFFIRGGSFIIETSIFSLWLIDGLGSVPQFRLSIEATFDVSNQSCNRLWFYLFVFLDLGCCGLLFFFLFVRSTLVSFFLLLFNFLLLHFFNIFRDRSSYLRKFRGLDGDLKLECTTKFLGSHII